MEFLIGILILVSFFGLVVYAIKGGNLAIGMLVMALVWTVLPMIGNTLVSSPEFMETYSDQVMTSWIDAFSSVFQSGPESWGSTLVNVVFGAWFGRVLLETEIASTLIKKVTELGGDRPAVTTILLGLVTTVIFSSLFGAGAVVAIGVIVLPILLSIGIPKRLALFSFMLSIGAGMFLNPVLFGQYSAFFLDAEGKETYLYADHVTWGMIALAVQVAFNIVLVIVFTKKQNSKFWAVQVPERPTRKKLDYAPNIALLTPFIPVVLLIAFNIPIIMGFLIGGFYAMLVCGRMKSFRGVCKIFGKDFFDGVVDTAPLVGFLLIVPMFNKAAELCIPYFNVILGDIVPQSTFLIAVAFAVLAPLGLFRGPLTLFGCGAAVLGILKGAGFATAFLAPLLIATSTVMEISCCLTQSWIAWGIGYTKVSSRDFLKLSLPCGWIITAILVMITYFMFG